MDFTRINAAGQVPKEPNNGYLPCVKIADLEKNKLFIVTKICRANTRFGPTVVVELDNAQAAFLPKKSAAFLLENPDQLEAMQDVVAAGVHPVAMRSIGTIYNQVEFTQDLEEWVDCDEDMRFLMETLRNISLEIV